MPDPVPPTIAAPEPVTTSRNEQPRLFVSHRHDDKDIADVIRSFVNSRSGGRVRVFQSSSSAADGPRIGHQLNKELLTNLWQANMLILLYTAPDQDWSYCMWECGVALDARSPDTRIVLFQCAGSSPAVFADQVRVNIRNLVDIQKFTNDFLTNPTFFPDYGEAVTGFHPQSAEVLEAAQDLYDRLQAVVPPHAEDGEEWPAYPYLRIKFSADQVRRVCEAPQPKRAEITRQILVDEALVSEADTEAARVFGLRGLLKETTFGKLLGNWRDRFPDADEGWVDALASQIESGAQGHFPSQTWSLLRAVDRNDGTWYAPSLIRVRTVPPERCAHFDVYLCKFSLDEDERVSVTVPKA